jgi:hypothetical protein
MMSKNVMKKAKKTLRLMNILCLIMPSVSIWIIPFYQSTISLINYFSNPGSPKPTFDLGHILQRSLPVYKKI